MANRVASASCTSLLALTEKDMNLPKLVAFSYDPFSSHELVQALFMSVDEECGDLMYLKILSSI